MAPGNVSLIGDLMNLQYSSSLIYIYRLLLNAYPSAYRVQFEDEMYDTFFEGAQEAEATDNLTPFLLREFRDIPRSLIKAYWDGWMMKLENRMQILRDLASDSDLPPAPSDGRESWRQVFFEMGLFLIAGLLLILVTYLPFDVLHPGWQRDVQFLGDIILPTAIPILLFGLIRGLPRWAYPFAGVLLYYSGFVAGQTGLWLFLIVMLLATSMFFLAAILIDPNPSLLPIPIRRVWQSISLDWTRLSFAVYGAMPLIILKAFDDAHTNSRTPYFAFSILVMVLGALIYSRSRDPAIQITILLAGLTFSIWGAWLDRVSFANGLLNWTTVTSTGLEAIAWMAVLWVQWSSLILLPVVFVLLNGLVHQKRAV